MHPLHIIAHNICVAASLYKAHSIGLLSCPCYGRLIWWRSGCGIAQPSPGWLAGGVGLADILDLTSDPVTAGMPSLPGCDYTPDRKKGGLQ